MSFPRLRARGRVPHKIDMAALGDEFRQSFCRVCWVPPFHCVLYGRGHCDRKTPVSSNRVKGDVLMRSQALATAGTIFEFSS